MICFKLVGCFLAVFQLKEGRFSSRMVKKQDFPLQAMLVFSLSVNKGPLLRMRWEMETPVICKHSCYVNTGHKLCLQIRNLNAINMKNSCCSLPSFACKCEHVKNNNNNNNR